MDRAHITRGIVAEAAAVGNTSKLGLRAFSNLTRAPLCSLVNQ